MTDTIERLAEKAKTSTEAEARARRVHRSYDQGWFSAGGVFEGLRAVERGEQPYVTFAIAPHPAVPDPSPGNPEFITIGRAVIEGVLSWRYCGGDKGTDPAGYGSHAVCATWEDQDLGYASTRVAMMLQQRCRPGWAIYRQPVAEQCRAAISKAKSP